MMKNILIIFFLFLCYNVVAQNNPSGVPTQFSTGWFRHGWDQSDSGKIFTSRAPNFTPRFPGTVEFYQDAGVDSLLHLWTGGRWLKLIPGFDSASLSNRINLKLNITDTTNKWWGIGKRWVDTVYRVNDSTVGFTVNGGAQQTFEIKGGASGGGGSGTVTSVGLSLPSAFSVTPSSITTNGTFNVTMPGLSTQYVRANGTVATTDTGMIPDFTAKVRGLFSGTSPISYNSSTGTFSLDNIGVPGACTNCNLTINAKGQVTLYSSGSASGVAVDTIFRTSGIDSIYFTINGVQYAIKDSTGSGSAFATNNLASGFRWVQSPAGDIKTVYNSNTIKWDSTSNSNALTAKADTSVLATKYDVSLKQSFLFLNVKDFGATGDGVTDDAAAIQATFDYVKNNPTTVYKIVFPAGNYLVGSTIQLPQRINGTTESPRLGVEGYGAKIFTTAAIPIFERMPATQTIALDSLISSWICSIRGITFEGNGTTGQCGIRVGAIYSWVVEDCTFRTLDTALVWRFSLQGNIKGCRFQSNKTDNIVLNFGEMWGGTDANSASNSNLIENCRVFGANGANSHLRAEGANAVLVKNFISEGFNPRYNIILDSRGSTTVTFCNLEDLHIESDGGIFPINTRFKIRAGGIFTIKNVYDQYPDTLFNSANTAGSATILFDRIVYTGALPATPFNTETGSSTLGYNIVFQNIADADFFKTKLFNASSWANGVVPIEIFLYYQHSSGTGIAAISTGGSIALENNTSIGGRLIYSIDDFYSFGGLPGINNSRPTAAFVGTTGMYVDNSARYNFGSATTTPDTYLERNGASILRVGKSIKTIDSVMIGLTRVGSNSDSVLVIDATTRAIKTVAQSSFGGPTLYTGDGTLLSDRNVASGGFTLRLTGANNSDTLLSINNTGTSGTGLYSIGTLFGANLQSTNIGAYVFGTTQGMQVKSTTDEAVFAQSDGMRAVKLVTNLSATNTVAEIANLQRAVASGVGANGIGAAITLSAENTSGGQVTTAQFVGKFTTATSGSEVSQVSIIGTNNSVTGTILSIEGDGSLTTYGKRVIKVTTSSAGTLTLGNAESYIFNGTTTTWTLPAVSGTTGTIYYLKNIGSGSITLNADSGNNEIFTSSAVNTTTITTGSAIILISNGTYWTVN